MESARIPENRLFRPEEIELYEGAMGGHAGDRGIEQLERRRWRGEQESLAELDAHLHADGKLLAGFDSFADRPYLELAARVNDRLDEAMLDVIGAKARDQFTIQLQEVRGNGDQVGKPGLASAEVVVGNKHLATMDFSNQRLHLLSVADKRLGDFKSELIMLR